MTIFLSIVVHLSLSSINDLSYICFETFIREPLFQDFIILRIFLEFCL